MTSSPPPHSNIKEVSQFIHKESVEMERDRAEERFRLLCMRFQRACLIRMKQEEKRNAHSPLLSFLGPDR